MKELGNLLITFTCKMIAFIIMILPDRWRPKVAAVAGKVVVKDGEKLLDGRPGKYGACAEG